ncbi:MAG: zf-HC2 protein [Bacteroidetes bacterium]|nr:zf-HC2 protein [Bacteroidota bacterium]
MIRHADAKLMLYDLLQNELTPLQRSEVEAHLVVCKECGAELQSLREIITLVPRPDTDASDGRSEQYWNLFASKVEQEVR